MNQSGDAAEQIVRLSLDGVEVAAKITGTAAKEIALLLIAALKNPKLKPRGKARLVSMLKSGKPLEIFSVKESDLQKFMQGAKQYGIVYCVLRNTKNSPDGLVDIMVKADDAPKISRLVERFKFATVDKGRIESEIIAERAERSAEPAPETEPDAKEIADTEKLLDELQGTPEGKAEPEQRDVAPILAHGAGREEQIKSEPITAEKEDSRPLSERPEATVAQPLPPSGPISENEKKSERVSLSKPSVKKELREITASKKAKEADTPKRDERTAAERPKTAPPVTTHRQPQRSKSKTNKSKGSR